MNGSGSDDGRMKGVEAADIVDEDRPCGLATDNGSEAAGNPDETE